MINLIYIVCKSSEEFHKMSGNEHLTFSDNISSIFSILYFIYS